VMRSRLNPRMEPMPGDPKECREHAKNCVELAEHASTAQGRQKFIDLAETWLKLAREIEGVQGFLEAMDGAAFDMPKVGLLSFPNEAGRAPVE